MASVDAVFDDALANVKEAINADKAGNYPKAVNLYERALERFLHVITCESRYSLLAVLASAHIKYAAGGVFAPGADLRRCFLAMLRDEPVLVFQLCALRSALAVRGKLLSLLGFKILLFYIRFSTAYLAALVLPAQIPGARFRGRAYEPKQSSTWCEQNS